MDRPRMSMEQIATLVVGQEVNVGVGVYGCKGKVVKLTEDSVGVQCSGSNLTIYQFDKNGKETSDSRRQRIVSGGPPEEFVTGDWHLFPEVEPWYVLQDEKVQ